MACPKCQQPDPTASGELPEAEFELAPPAVASPPASLYAPAPPVPSRREAAPDQRLIFGAIAGAGGLVLMLLLAIMISRLVFRPRTIATVPGAVPAATGGATAIVPPPAPPEALPEGWSWTTIHGRFQVATPRPLELVANAPPPGCVFRVGCGVPGETGTYEILIVRNEYPLINSLAARQKTSKKSVLEAAAEGITLQINTVNVNGMTGVLSARDDNVHLRSLEIFPDDNAWYACLNAYGTPGAFSPGDSDHFIRSFRMISGAPPPVPPSPVPSPPPVQQLPQVARPVVPDTIAPPGVFVQVKPPEFLQGEAPIAWTPTTMMNRFEVTAPGVLKEVRFTDTPAKQKCFGVLVGQREAQVSYQVIFMKSATPGRKGDTLEAAEKASRESSRRFAPAGHSHKVTRTTLDGLPAFEIERSDAMQRYKTIVWFTADFEWKAYIQTHGPLAMTDAEMDRFLYSFRQVKPGGL